METRVTERTSHFKYDTPADTESCVDEKSSKHVYEYDHFEIHKIENILTNLLLSAEHTQQVKKELLFHPQLERLIR